MIGRKIIITLAVLLSASSCAGPNAVVDPVEESVSAAANGTAPEVDATAPEHWRDVDPANLLVITLESGDVVVELAPGFAPAHVAQMRQLARTGHYAGTATFYRVIDNFVAQGGVLREVESDDEDAYDDGIGTLQAEFERPLGDLLFVRNESPDLYAPVTGHIDGFAVGYDPEAGTVWPLHCYGVMAMARDADPDTGSSHFYIVIGRDQRYLDRNLTVFGRVLRGMEHLQKVARGERAVDSGVIANPADRTPILGITIADDLPEGDRPALQVMRSESPAFAHEKERRFYRESDFFQRKPKVVEACAMPGPVRVKPRE